MDTARPLFFFTEAVDFLSAQLGSAPPDALLLGSGLGEFVDDIPGIRGLAYREIPHFPVPTVAGHPGKLSVGSHKGRPFCALQGRVHVYEGYALAQVAFPAQVLGLWGVKRFVVANAAGAINPVFCPGDLMLIQDHINLMGGSPLRGPNLDALGERFPEMGEAYDRSLLAWARQCGQDLGLKLREGVYVGLPGPNYETPAEIRMCWLVGADAVGMSTVPEVIALNQMRKRVLGVSCITNMAAGMQPERLRHEEVLAVVSQMQEKASGLILKILERPEESSERERQPARTARD